MNPSETYCRNCETPLQGSFCPSCGQRASIHKVTFRETFEDLTSAVFSIDAPFVRTIKELIIAPGRLFRSYLSGKRKSYYKPVAFFVVMTVGYLILRSLVQFDPFENSSVDKSKLPDADTILATRDYMLAHINKLLFFFVFTLGLMMKLFFYKRYSLAEYLAVSFYMVGIYTFFGVFNVLLVRFAGPNWQTFAILVMLVYFIYALVSFLEGSKIWIVLKGLLAYIFGFVLYTLLAFGLSYIVIKYF